MKRDKPEMLTAKQFAKRADVAYPTVMKWLKEGIIPDAQLIEDERFGPHWDIPAESLDKVAKRKPGPKKATASTKPETKPGAKKRASKKAGN